MAKKVKKNQTAIHVAFSIILIVVVYALVQLIIFLRQPTNSTLVRNGEIVEAEEVIGYIIRDEEIIDTSAYAGIQNIVINDESRVAKGGTIISYVSSEQKKLLEKIFRIIQIFVHFPVGRYNSLVHNKFSSII